MEGVLSVKGSSVSFVTVQKKNVHNYFLDLKYSGYGFLTDAFIHPFIRCRFGCLALRFLTGYIYRELLLLSNLFHERP